MEDDGRRDALPQTDFRVARKGYDRTEVERWVGAAAERVAALEAERAELESRLRSLGAEEPTSLETEFATVAREVEAILQAAREAAEGLRGRAAADAARWRRESEQDATAMRQEAEQEATRLRREAADEVRRIRAAAETDAESVRRDAWETGTALLEQARERAEEVRDEAAEDALLSRAQGEQEAHRLLASARREIEEESRVARVEAERMLARARTESDTITEAARREAEAAQERARALEQRRSDLMRELEETRSAIAELEADLTARREALRLPEDEPADLSTVRVLHGDEEDDDEDRAPAASGEARRWEPERESVRIIDPLQDRAEPVDALAMAAEVQRLRERAAAEAAAAVAEPEPVPEIQPEPVGKASSEPAPAGVESESESEPAPAGVEPEPESESEAEVEPVVEPEPVAEAGPGPEVEPVAELEPDPGIADAEPEPEPVAAAEEDDDAVPVPRIDDLFARLRGNAVPAPVPEPAPAVVQPVEEEPARPPLAPVASLAGDDAPDPFELRERLLIPIVNRSLREVKRLVVDLQNLALEELRTHPGDWVPESAMFGAALGPTLDDLAGEAALAGAEAAGVLFGAAQTPRFDLAVSGDAAGIGAALASAVGEAITRSAGSGAGPRQTSAAVSRVFRAWRTDEAERRVRATAFAAYHRGLLAGCDELGVTAVRGLADGPVCRECPAGNGGPFPPGADLPDGTVLPPAHVECTCTLAPAD